jgi:hypothetical protein
LDDGLQRITEIVGEGAEFFGQLGRDFVGWIWHGRLSLSVAFEILNPARQKAGGKMENSSLSLAAAKARVEGPTYRSGEPLRHPKTRAGTAERAGRLRLRIGSASLTGGQQPVEY